MNSKFEKHGYLFPERVYRCPCLRLAIEECFLNEENSSIADIAYISCNIFSAERTIRCND